MIALKLDFPGRRTGNAQGPGFIQLLPPISGMVKGPKIKVRGQDNLPGNIVFGKGLKILRLKGLYVTLMTIFSFKSRLEN